MGQQRSKVRIRLIAYPPPGTNETGETCISGPVELPVNRTPSSRIILNSGKVRHMAATPVGLVIPHIVECNDWTIGINRAGNDVVTITLCITSRATSLYANYKHYNEQHQYYHFPDKGRKGLSGKMHTTSLLFVIRYTADATLSQSIH